MLIMDFAGGISRSLFRWLAAAQVFCLHRSLLTETREENANQQPAYFPPPAGCKPPCCRCEQPEVTLASQHFGVGKENNLDLPSKHINGGE